MPICVNGHDSSATDWCDVCGHRVPPAAPARPGSSASSASVTPISPTPPSGSPPAGPVSAVHVPPVPAPARPTESAASELCPNCATPREGSALFCEECRYNFRTHAATVVPQPTAPELPPYQRYEPHGSRPSQINRPAEALPAESVTVTSGSGDYVIDRPSGSVPVPPAGSGATGTGTAAGRGPAAPAAAGLGTAWMAVIAADRGYFTAMMARSGPDAEQLYFPAYSPEVQLPLTGHQVTIGRRRHTTGEAPDIDLSRAPEDPGVSHHHAVLVQQPDSSWAVVDQDSTNGTTINLAEDSIRPYLPVPLADGDRVHVGAWTTITIRRA